MAVIVTEPSALLVTETYQQGTNEPVPNRAKIETSKEETDHLGGLVHVPQLRGFEPAFFHQLFAQIPEESEKRIK